MVNRTPPSATAICPAKALMAIHSSRASQAALSLITSFWIWLFLSNCILATSLCWLAAISSKSRRSLCLYCFLKRM